MRDPRTLSHSSSLLLATTENQYNWPFGAPFVFTVYILGAEAHATSPVFNPD